MTSLDQYVIRIQRIYNFWFLHAILSTVLNVYGFIIHFYIIFGTNLLTGGPAHIAVFLPISVFRRKGISNGVQMEWNLRERDFQPNVIQETWSRHQGSFEEATRQGARLPPGRALHPCGPLVAPPTYFFLLYISTYPPNIQEHHENLIPPPQPSVPERSYLGAFSGAPPGGIDHRGPLHQLHGLSGDVWVVYFRPTGPLLLARWLLLSLWISIQSSPRSSWRSIRCNLLLRCVCQDPNCGFMIKSIYEQYLHLLWILLSMIGLSLQVSSNY